MVVIDLGWLNEEQNEQYNKSNQQERTTIYN